MLTRNIYVFRQYALNKLSLLKNRFQLPQKWKGPRTEKWSEYWGQLITDYKLVVKGVIDDAQAKPYKAAVITSGLGVAFTAIRTNPDEYSFNDYFRQCVTILGTCSDQIRSPTSEHHVQHLVECQNQGLLRTTNLIFFTLLWVADFSKDCDIYAAHCKYLKPRFLTFHQRIIDVGAFDTWWNLKRKMIDYDINPNEWE